MSRANTFYSLGVMPALMGLGHLAPAIGAIQTATGAYQFPGYLLGLIGTISGLVDSIDTYKDVAKQDRPRKWIWKSWLYGMWAIVFFCTYMSGFQTAIIIYRVLPLGLLWGAPCIPQYSAAKGWYFTKPKTLLVEAKSLVVATCMASVCAEASMVYFCQRQGEQCSGDSLRRRSLCIAILYQFFRETSCDMRDIVEDTREGLDTLPVKLGKTNTMMLMAGLGWVLDSLLTRSVLVGSSGVLIRYPEVACSLLRVGLTLAAYSKVLQYPRHNHFAWGAMSLLGLTPVLFAQAQLRS